MPEILAAFVVQILRCVNAQRGGKLNLAFWHHFESRVNAPLTAGAVHPASIGSAAISGADFPKVRPILEVSSGDRVLVGDILFRDRAHPQIAWVSPLAGTVQSIDLAPRRMLSALVIEASGKNDEPPAEIPQATTAEALRAVLLARGLWPAFQRRPFGYLPAPDQMADAIIVAATETEPWAPDPRVILQERGPEFLRGAEALALLTDGPVYICLPPGHGFTSPANARLRISEVTGPHPAGLAGTQVRRLHPVADGGSVWTIGYQDVIAIGHLLETGRYLPDRVISIAGARGEQAHLVRAVPGALIGDLLADTAEISAFRAISGSVVSGRKAAWLGYRHRQISILTNVPANLNSSRRPAAFRGQRPSPLIPTTKLEAALPYGLPVVPLMRALSVGDAESAQRLGCLDLIEEDVALLSSLCTSGSDYGQLLRRVLDELEDDA